MTDPFVGTLSFFRVYSGSIKFGSELQNTDRRSTEKIGLLTVGTHIPIVDEREVLDAEYLLVGPWHFFKGFRKRSTDFKGRWILPLPELRVI